MSSLAGALIPPNTSNYEYEEDVKMTTDQSIESDPEDTTHKQDDDEEMDDLFGNDAGVEEVARLDAASSTSPSRQDSERLLSPERDHRQALEYEENEDPAEVAVVVREASVAFPNIPVPRSSDESNWVLRMPNYVHVDSKPFDCEYYYGPEQYEDFGQSSQLNREKSMSIKLKVENTLRWRWVKDEFGNYSKQTNSRIIRWSDGSLSLRLGKELFDVNQTVDTSATIPRAPGPQASGSQSQSQSQATLPSQSERTSDSPSKAQGLTYLVAQHKRAQVLQAEALITGSMTLRPTGMQSDVHRMLARAVGQKHNKVARLRIAADPTIDPEREVQELAKANAKKSKRRMENNGLGRKRRKGIRRRTADLWSDDDDDDEAAILGAGSDDDYDVGGFGSPDRKQSGQDRERAGYQEDDFLVADDSGEDGGDGSQRRKRRSEEDRMEDDPLDKLEEKLQAQEDAKRRQREDDGSETGVRMDVESEDEDEQAIRRANSAPGRKRRALNFDEDDD